MTSEYNRALETAERVIATALKAAENRWEHKGLTTARDIVKALMQAEGEDND